MASALKGTMVLSSGITIRLVEAVPAGPPYKIEFADGVDGLGVQRWTPMAGFSVQDVTDILKGVGFLP